VPTLISPSPRRWRLFPSATADRHPDCRQSDLYLFGCVRVSWPERHARLSRSFFERMGDPDERGPSASCSPTTRSSRSRERGLRGRTPRRRSRVPRTALRARGQGVRPVDRRRRSRRQSGDPPRRRQRRRAVRGRAVRRRLRGLRGRDPPAGRVQRPRGRGVVEA